MARFKVVMVIQDNNPLPDWVGQRLADAGIDFSVHLCWSAEELAHWAADADLVWSYGGRHGLLEGQNLGLLKRCVAILRTGSGTDNIDTPTATGLGILVTNTPQATAGSVSDHAIALLFSLVRQVSRHDRLIRAGTWNSRRAMPLRRWQGATLGLVGLGRVPQLMIGKLCGFKMTFLAYDPYVGAEDAAKRGAEKVDLPELLGRSDYVSLHCPLTDRTYHLIGERELRLMRPGVLLINTARGAIIDEAALVRALREGWIGGAGLDVLEQEPPTTDHPLLHLDNVVISPHLAGYSDTFPQEFCEASVEAILDIAAGRRPLSVVNPEVEWKSGC
jgi:D-3-phosphoglycerate dehydrogenase